MSDLIKNNFDLLLYNTLILNKEHISMCNDSIVRISEKVFFRSFSQHITVQHRLVSQSENVFLRSLTQNITAQHRLTRKICE